VGAVPRPKPFTCLFLCKTPLHTLPIWSVVFTPSSAALVFPSLCPGSLPSYILFTSPDLIFQFLTNLPVLRGEVCVGLSSQGIQSHCLFVSMELAASVVLTKPLSPDHTYNLDLSW
jgi:hypothetical protein